MKQVIPFINDIDLESNILDITSIALEHNLKMENNDSIVGEFTISGKYKANDISIDEEVFEKKVDFDITLDDKYDASRVQIDIDDFYYEIIDKKYLRVHIDVLVSNLVYQKIEKPHIIEEEPLVIKALSDLKQEMKKIEERNENMQKELQTQKNDEEVILENKKEEQINDARKDINFDFSSNILSQEEKYSMYKVHIIRENETIENIKEKYNTTKEELEKYNNLDNIILGDKIIIPTNNE